MCLALPGVEGSASSTIKIIEPMKGINPISNHQPERSVSCSLLTERERPEMVRCRASRRVSTDPIVADLSGNAKKRRVCARIP